MMAVWVFWASVVLIVYAYAGFPALLALRAFFAPRPTPEGDGSQPRVSYLIVAYNEVDVVARKLDNVFELDYPSDRLQVVFASDGSDDGTVAAARAHPRAADCLILDLPRGGKNASLNQAVAVATGEILVFSDADSMLEPGALQALVDPFADPQVGGVAGDFEYLDPDSKGEGETAYWRVDRIWKQLESRGGQLTSATGQIYGIRASLASSVPDGVTDDFFMSTGVIEAGYRLVFQDRAIARGPVAESADVELKRKVRVAGRGFASAWARRSLFDLRRFGFYSIQLFSHKILRRLVGLPLATLLVASALLAWTHPFYGLALFGQLVFHGLALAGWRARNAPGGQGRLLSIPLYFDLVNLAGARAGFDFLRGKRYLHWSPERASERPVEPAAKAVDVPEAGA